MKTITKNLLLISSLLYLSLPENANALPGFARQTGEDCSACHIQNMPKLNTHGRHFARSGFTLYDKESEIQSLIEGSDIPLGLPAVLNASVVMKAHYNKTSTSRGSVNVLEGTGLYFGGRIADNVGGIISLTGDPAEARDVVFGGKTILVYKVFDGMSGLSLYSTQTNGLFAGMEDYNTGLYAPLKQFENATATNAAQATGLGRGAATGLQAYYANDYLLATFGGMIPAQNSEGIDVGGSIIPFGRLAYNQPLMGWELMLGVYGFSGTIKASDQSLNGTLIDTNANLVSVEKVGFGFDFEASGAIANMSTLLTANLVLKNSVSHDGNLSDENLQNIDNQAASIELQINPIEPLGLKVAYLYYNNRATEDGLEFIRSYDYSAPSLGVSYLFRENFDLDMEYTYNYPKGVDMHNFYEFYLFARVAF